MDATRLRELSTSVRPGDPESPVFRVEVVVATGSTNADLTVRAVAGEREGLVLVAEHQQAGRGRLDRRWETPERAALTFSVLLRPGAAGSRLARVTIAIAFQRVKLLMRRSSSLFPG